MTPRFSHSAAIVSTEVRNMSPEQLAAMGLEDMGIDPDVEVAGFVNTEPAEYLVIEDRFPNSGLA
jgi:hypothetical protein